MALFLDLLDKITGGKDDTAERQANASRVVGINGDTLAIRLPDTSASGQIASNVFRSLGVQNTQGADTNPSLLNLDGLIERGAGGNIKIDFTSLGGKVFNGTEADLGKLSGQELLNTIGNAPQQAATGGTSANGGIFQGSLLGGQAVQTQELRPDLSTQNLSDDVASRNSQLDGLSLGLKNQNVSDGLFSKISGAGLDDDESEELLKLFRIAADGGT